MSSSSGFRSSIVTTCGSSAIPHFGHVPGASRTTSGCIGQVQVVVVVGRAGAAGSSAMPHFGQAPGWSCRTSGSIGQTYSVPFTTGSGVRGAAPMNVSGAALNRCRHDCAQK